MGHESHAQTDDAQLPIMGLEQVQKARSFHQSFPQYSQTPLARLEACPGSWG